MTVKQMLDSLKCKLGHHDWKAIDNLDIDHEEELDEDVVIHWNALIPLRWECQHCEEVKEIGFTKVQARDSGGGVISSWTSGREESDTQNYDRGF